jgi:hypothetical protein
VRPPPDGWRHLYLSVPAWPAKASVSWSKAVARERVFRGQGVRGAPGVRLADPLASLLVGGEAPVSLGEDLPSAVRHAAGLAPCHRTGEWTVEVDGAPELAAWAPAWAREGVTRLALRGEAADPEVAHRIRRTAPSLELAAEVELALLSDPSARLGALVEAGVTSVALVEVESRGDAGRTDPDTSLAWQGALRALAARGWVLADLAFAHVAAGGPAGRGPCHPRAIRAREPVLGLGPGAVTFRNPCRRWNLARAPSYLAAIARGEDPRGGGERLDADQVRLERIWAGLRRARGVRCPGAELRVPREWYASGWIRPVPGRIVPTFDGWLHADTLAVELAARAERNGRSRGSGGSTDGTGAESFQE